MTGPISRHTITADTKLPEPVRLDVTITLPLEVSNLDYDLSRLGEFLGYHFSNYSDGRYPFDTELVRHALSATLKRVVAQCVEDAEYEKYRGEYVITGPGRKTAKGCVTAEEILRNFGVFMADGMKFAVTLPKTVTND
jgi:hypothetical protein